MPLLRRHHSRSAKDFGNQRLEQWRTEASLLLTGYLHIWKSVILSFHVWPLSDTGQVGSIYPSGGAVSTRRWTAVFLLPMNGTSPLQRPAQCQDSVSV